MNVRVIMMTQITDGPVWNEHVSRILNTVDWQWYFKSFFAHFFAEVKNAVGEKSTILPQILKLIQKIFLLKSIL